MKGQAPTEAAVSDKSIAVLPFADMSEKKDQEYFADGMAEEILDLLAKVPGLHVPARTSSFYFKGKSEDIPTIARRLMVGHVLEGSVDYAVAWAELSMALTYVWNSGFLPQGRTVQQQRTLALNDAERAVTINPNLGVAHEALAEIRFWFDWDWSKVAVEIDKARALDPSSTTALTQAGAPAMLRGRPMVALQLWELASAQDPLNSEAQLYLAEVHYVLGQFTEAEAAARKAVELNPMVPASHLPLSRALLALGQHEAALAEIEKERDPGYRAFARARAYIVLARQADADAALSQLEKKYGAEQRYNIATLHALRGERDQAFSWLDGAYLQHDPSVIGIPPITAEPDLQNLHGDPRFKALLQKINLAE